MIDVLLGAVIPHPKVTKAIFSTVYFMPTREYFNWSLEMFCLLVNLPIQSRKFTKSVKLYVVNK